MYPETDVLPNACALDNASVAVMTTEAIAAALGRAVNARTLKATTMGPAPVIVLEVRVKLVLSKVFVALLAE